MERGYFFGWDFEAWGVARLVLLGGFRFIGGRDRASPPFFKFSSNRKIGRIRPMGVATFVQWEWPDTSTRWATFVQWLVRALATFVQWLVRGSM
ncbi:hypothetical protein QQ25_24755 [Mycolicibacterium setense]|nr:hypothetical protein QQ25_24755 [Mycolicibacterium setense]